MKAFHFTLERMRDYKTQVLDKEKGVLLSLRRHLNDIEEEMVRVRQFKEDKSHELMEKQLQGMFQQEMAVYAFYIENSRRQLKQLEVDRKKAAHEVECQTRVVVAASQEVSGLEKLEEKQRSEYRYLLAKDEERTISEMVSTGRFKQPGMEET